MSDAAERERLVQQARRLRREGLFYSQIGIVLGISTNKAWRLLNPERQQKIESRASARKERVPCPRCGHAMRPGSKQCHDCYRRSS